MKPHLAVSTEPSGQGALRAVFSPTQTSASASASRTSFASLAPSPHGLTSALPSAPVSAAGRTSTLSPPASATASTFSVPSREPRSPRASAFSKSIKPLAVFVDASVDPRTRFTDLVEIAQGESGSVFSARVVGTTEPFAPPTAPSSPASPLATPSTSAQTRPVALKIVPAASNTTKLASLRRELDLVRGIRHPNVLRFEAVFVDVPGEAIWLGMELMERSLADVLALRDAEGLEDTERRSVRVGERLIARFVWDVLLALSYLRKQHIAHRDLRSDNLLLNRDGVLKLADFGSAVRHPPGTQKLSENVGVLYWQAPEIRTGLYDPLKVDVWSLGATTWELAAGVPPFADVEDPRALESAYKLPPLPEDEGEVPMSRAFHDFLHLCAQPVGSRAEVDELLNAHFVRTACPRSTVVHLLATCKTIENKVLGRESDE
ncbi:kinase-like domain-containing protein [Vararia minispora EC-137]|uniref:Kinase-like domain-containing protein n=1 Tax=Vararia minispora EC-137 TaxID=1314806 RepID=A0ACB8QII7_9AGAM|nr:kinase-like domain-containing protein [Vararia minispora EC-137]